MKCFLKILVGLLFGCLGMMPEKSWCQNTIGLPYIINYPTEITHAAAQSWQVEEDRLGNMYFANNAGLLCYNGNDWKTFPLPDKTFLRSLSIAADDKIYVGGQDAIGYFYPALNGRLQYHSLLELIPPDDRSFADVWNIVIYNNEVFFRSAYRIFRYKVSANKMEVYHASAHSRWLYMGVINGQLYAQDEAPMQMRRFQQQQWLPASFNPPYNIMSVLPYNGREDTALVATWKDGLFLKTGDQLHQLKVDPAIRKHQLYSICLINRNTYALGTVSNGIYFINHNGSVVRHLSIHEGIQNNHVRTLYTDKALNLWAGLEEGIDLIHYNSSINKIKPLLQQSTSAYTVRIIANTLYIGTPEGLYQAKIGKAAPGNAGDISLQPSSFSLLPHSDGQVWDVDSAGGMLLMTHHEGLYNIDANHAQFITGDHKGVWQIRHLPLPGRLVAGTYEGLQLFLLAGGKLKTITLHNNSLKESLRFIEVDETQRIVWASHPYRGIYEIRLSKGFDSILSTRLLTQANGLPGKLDNYVFKINGTIVFATARGIYEFNRKKDVFQPSQQYAAVFGNIPVRYMVADANGKIWFASGDKVGVAGKNVIKYIPELKGQLVSSFEKIYPYDDSNVFIPSYKGVLHLNYSSYEKKNKLPEAHLTRVLAHDKYDSLLYSDYFTDNGKLVKVQPASAIRRLPPGFQSFHFEFASAQLSGSGKVLYSYRLAGWNNEWSAWSPQKFKDFTNLSYGSYRFEVRVQDNLGNISAPEVYAFYIRPRWYQTRLAYALYTLLLLLLIWGLNKLHNRRLHIQRRKFEKEEAQLKYLHELELQKNEKQIIQLRNDRLETEVLYKNKELASTTMHLYKRGRLLGKIKEELADATKKIPLKEDRADFVKVLKLISEEEKRDGDWKQFAVHFDQVHNHFLARIKAAYPDLSSTDLKICAYLKMNLSSKEIAQLLSISLKGVEVARYRLRKKLDLAANVNLSDFINGIALREGVLHPVTALTTMAAIN